MAEERPHVALIVETSKAFGRGLLRGISKYITAHKRWSIYVDERSVGDPPPGWLDDWNGHGIIMRAQTKKIADVVEGLRVPAVDTLHQLQGLNVPAVIADDEAIAQVAAEHLLERHFRHFAFVGVERAFWSKLRRDAFVEFLHRAGHVCQVYSPLSRRRFLESWEGGQDDLAEWIRELPKPVGIFVAHDLRSLCVLDACRRIDVAVPEQVAVVGVDNDEVLCDLGDPPLSSVKLDFETMGYEAAALLERLMRKQQPPKSPILVRPVGVETRLSTDVVAIADSATAAALRYIRHNACDGIGVAQVARHCGVSRRVLERNFSRFLNSSPHEQIVRVKLTRAKELLAETDYTLDAIAAKSGFSNAAYLSVLFKKQVGETPGDFRLTAQLQETTSRS
jgi:LacI family transcriptional regulator